MGEIDVSDWVIYRPHPAAQAEDGEVMRIDPERGTAMVLYRGDRTAKSTRLADLSPGRPSVASGTAATRTRATSPLDTAERTPTAGAQPGPPLSPTRPRPTRATEVVGVGTAPPLLPAPPKGTEP